MNSGTSGMTGENTVTGNARIEPLEPRRLHAATLQVLASLGTTADPQLSQSGIAVDAAGDVFGTQFRSGATVGETFELAAGSTAAVATAAFPADFAGDAPNADIPVGRLVRDAAGDLFGLTGGPYGTDGPNATGSLWELPAGATAPRLLHRFDNPYSPDSLSIDVAGNLYGSAQVIGGGSVWFEYPSGGSGLRQLTPTANGDVGLVTSDAMGDLYGTVATGFGGFHGQYVQYRERLISVPAAAATVAATTAVPAVPVALTSDVYTGHDGTFALTPGADGSLYASESHAVLFRPAIGGPMRERAALLPDAAYTIASAPFVDADGNVFVVAQQIGADSRTGQLLVLEATAGSAALEPLATAPGASVTYGAAADLVADASGNLFGIYDMYVDGVSQSVVYELDGHPAAVQPTPTPTPINPSPLRPAIVADPSALSTQVAVRRPRGTVTVTVTNTGPTRTAGRTTIAVYAADTRIATLTRRLKLAPGAATQLAVPIKSGPKAIGAYPLVARVTDTSHRSATSDVGGVLSVVDHFVSLGVTVVRMTPSAAPGGPITLKLRVTNAGDQASASYAEFDVVLTDAATGFRVFVPPASQRLALTPGRTDRVSVQVLLPQTAPAGVYQLQVSLSEGSTGSTAAATSPLAIVA